MVDQGDFAGLQSPHEALGSAVGADKAMDGAGRRSVEDAACTPRVPTEHAEDSTRMPFR